MSDSETTPRTKAFSPAKLGGLELRNRFVKAGAYEGMCPGGIPSEALLRHHLDLAKGGVGMTTVAYCAVNADGRTFEQQMYMRYEVLPELRKITDACHAQGAKVSLQLGHCGFFSRNKQVTDGKPRGPSYNMNLYGFLVGMPLGRPMSEELIAKTADDFGEAAAKAVQAGFDAVELHMGHGYLLSQFISPATNHRKDRYGGSLENRTRFAVEVLHKVRARVPAGFPIVCKTNLDDGFWGGLKVDEAVEVAKILEREGADALVLSGGFTSLSAFYLFRGNVPRKEMIEVEHLKLMKVALALFGWIVMRYYPFQELYFLEQARKVRAAVKMALGYLGGVVSIDGVEKVMSEGFDFVVMARALVNDPAFVHKLQAGEVKRSGCDACNKCVAEMDRPGGVRCVCADTLKAA
ncbi:MAG TPA: NADH:flavin oxidoreductase [Myxococcales bacterium]|jgi:2,4-dienoyl-CoA reductase-like NADH-dependent reductase (Old Yellow Enzyme family)